MTTLAKFYEYYFAVGKGKGHNDTTMTMLMDLVTNFVRRHDCSYDDLALRMFNINNTYMVELS